MKTAYELSDKKKFIIIREYAEKPTSGWAIPEKSWLDLYTEIMKYRIPIPTDEIFVIFDSLIENELIDKTKLKSIAKHKHMFEEIRQYIEEEI